MPGLFGKGRDWVLAPISGTMILVCYVAAAVGVWRGDFELTMLNLIFAEVVGMRRDKYLDGEAPKRHPACVAPHCLRGGKCTGPCKIDR